MSQISRPTDLRLTGLTASLRSCQLFSGLLADDLAIIASFVQPLRLAKGDYLFHEGEPARGCYLVQSGAVSVHRVNAAGKEQVIHVFRGGESMAEAALASPTGYPANARAVEPSTVILIPKAPILDLIGRRPDLALRMLGSMSQHLRVLVGMLDDLTLKDVETRLLNWLIKHAEHQTRSRRRTWHQQRDPFAYVCTVARGALAGDRRQHAPGARRRRFAGSVSPPAGRRVTARCASGPNGDPDTGISLSRAAAAACGNEALAGGVVVETRARFGAARRAPGSLRTGAVKGPPTKRRKL
jgi:CRP/FNR family transcriptional regulator